MCWEKYDERRAEEERRDAELRRILEQAEAERERERAGDLPVARDEELVQA